jgi:hypothetical protein
LGRGQFGPRLSPRAEWQQDIGLQIKGTTPGGPRVFLLFPLLFFARLQLRILLIGLYPIIVFLISIPSSLSLPPPGSLRAEIQSCRSTCILLQQPHFFWRQPRKGKKKPHPSVHRDTRPVAVSLGSPQQRRQAAGGFLRLSGPDSARSRQQIAQHQAVTSRLAWTNKQERYVPPV